jgi:xanthine dehydrogenase iron-sulfur cluster and FAD-binding subunit A
MPASAQEKKAPLTVEERQVQFELRLWTDCEKSFEPAQNPKVSIQVGVCFSVWINNWCRLIADMRVVDNVNNMNRIKAEQDMVNAAYGICMDHATRGESKPEPGLWARLFGE